MRILLASIYDTARSGGLSSHVEEIAAGLARSGHAVSVATPDAGEPAWRRLLLDRAPRAALRLVDRDRAFLRWVGGRRSRLVRMLETALRTAVPDVIHAQDAIALLAAHDAAPAAGKRRPRLILTVHGDLANMAVSDGAVRADGRGRSRAESWESEAYAGADAIIAVDQRLRIHCLAAGAPGDVLAFPNFVDTGRFHPAGAEDAAARSDLRREIGVADGAPLLLVPRRLVRKNGVATAIRAMSERPLARLPGVAPVLLIAGSGPERAALISEAKRSGLLRDRRVRFLGDVPRVDLPPLYRVSDLVLIPSVPDEGVIEATSIAALEAMASEKTVIASAIGGLSEIITDAETGILVPPGDPAALAAAAARALEHAAETAGIGRRARARVIERHSTEGAVRALLDLYARRESRP